MNQEHTINQQISKQQQKNIYLTELLKNLEERLTESKTNKKQDLFVENNVELQKAQMKIATKRIDLYTQQLQKIKKTNTGTIVKELKDIQERVEQKKTILERLNVQAVNLGSEINQLKSKDYGQIKNKEISKIYLQRNYEMERLKKKLAQLQNIEGNLNYKPPARKTNRSFSQPIKQPQISKPQQKKTKIDQYALYKNLIKYYMISQQKLTTQIEGLQKDKMAKEAQNQKIKEEIAKYQQKIETLKKLRALPSIK